MKEKLKFNESLTLSMMIFGLFFGAGNLIFPSFLGYMSGTKVASSFIFFSITAIVSPMLAVVSGLKNKGLKNLASKVNPTFALIFSIAIYLAVGPGLAIPRAGVLPFEMTIYKFLPENVNKDFMRFIYSAIFFTIAILVSFRPNKLLERSGKFLTPTLLIMIILFFVGMLLNNPNMVGPAKGAYITSAEIKGFLDGYNTMDALGSANFGILIGYTLNNMGIREEKNILSYTKKTAFGAGIIFFMIYGMLAIIGYNISASQTNFENGAQILSFVADYLFGNLGIFILIAIFSIACLNTCIGLLIMISEFFASIYPKINQRGWTIILGLVSFIISNFGLNTILKISGPILNIIYPSTLCLIIMGLIDDKIKISSLTYKATCIVSILVPLIDYMTNLGIKLPLISKAVSSLPLSSLSMGWLLPTLVTIILSQIISKFVSK